MFSYKVNRRIELQLIQQLHGRELFKIIEANRAHIHAWHPWVDHIRSAADLDRCIGIWLQQFSRNQGFQAGIWFDGQLCGAVGHLKIDWANRSTFLSYWLDAAHQGQGIMTEACRALVTHAFQTLDLHRVTIECASENSRSRRIPERLGFKFEGLVRGAEWLHDHFADHAIYGMLKGEQVCVEPRPKVDHPSLQLVEFAS